MEMSFFESITLLELVEIFHPIFFEYSEIFWDKNSVSNEKLNL